MHWITATDFDRDEKVQAVTRLYNEIGIDRLAQERIAYYFKQAQKHLDAVSLPDDRKQELRRYAADMMHREW